MYRVLRILSDAEVAECRKIAAAAPFVDGRITNPHNTTKQNEQLHYVTAYQKSSQAASPGVRAERANSANSPSRR